MEMYEFYAIGSGLAILSIVVKELIDAKREVKHWREFAERSAETKGQMIVVFHKVVGDAIHFIENAEYDFANCNTHMGMDEGEVLGNRAWMKILIELKEAIGAPLDDMETTWKETFRLEDEKFEKYEIERQLRIMLGQLKGKQDEGNRQE